MGPGRDMCMCVCVCVCFVCVCVCVCVCVIYLKKEIEGKANTFIYNFSGHVRDKSIHSIRCIDMIH